MPAPQKDRIYFLVKDPHWTFLWWQLAPETVQRVAEQNSGQPGQLVLRIYDVTHILFDGSNAHAWFDVDVFFETNYWYLNIGASDRNYLAEVGYRRADGQFTPCARSHSIYLPRDHPSDAGAYETSTILLEG